MVVRIRLSNKLGEVRWKQADLIRSTNIRPTTVSEICNEWVDSIRLDHLALICDALNCDISDILELEPGGECEAKFHAVPPERIGKRNKKKTV